MRNDLTTGHVFPIVAGFFGVIVYERDTTVYVFQSETSYAETAARELGTKYAGRFVVADRDVAAWGRLTFKAQGAAVAI